MTEYIPRGLPKIELKDLLECIESNKPFTPKGRYISFWDNFKTDKDRPFDHQLFNRLIAALASGKCPQGVTLNLSDGYEWFGEPFIFQRFAEVLLTGRCPQGFGLDLSWNYLTDDDLEPLIAAIPSGQCPKGFYLNLHRARLDKTVQRLSAALTTGLCPDDFTLVLGECLAPEDVQDFAIALKMNRYPAGLSLDLSENFNGHNEAKAALAANTLADLLSCGICTKKLAIGYRINTPVAQIIEHAFGSLLRSGLYPPNFSLDLSQNKLGYTAVVGLLTSLGSGKAQRGLQLNLSANHLYDSNGECMKTLAQIFESGSCPQDLLIDLSKNSLTSFSTLLHVLKKGLYPEGLKLILRGCSLPLDQVKACLELPLLGLDKKITLDVSRNYAINNQLRDQWQQMIAHHDSQVDIVF